MATATISAQITKLKRLLREAQEAQNDSKDQQAALRAANSQVACLIAEIQERIENGESTGDPAMDLNIMVNNSVERGKSYKYLSWVRKELDAHPGELLVINETSVGWTMYKLPRSPILGRGTDRWGAKAVTISVDGRGVREWGHPDRWIEDDSVGFRDFDSRPTGNELHYSWYPIIGDEAVQRWAEQLEREEPFSAWTASRLLGRPLQVFPELEKQIRANREALVVSLLRTSDKLEGLRKDLAKWKRDPAAALKRDYSKIKLEVKETKNGVSIDFGYGAPIAEAEAVLHELVERGLSELDMVENPTLQGAAKLLDIELPTVPDE